MIIPTRKPETLTRKNNTTTCKSQENNTKNRDNPTLGTPAQSEPLQL